MSPERKDSARAVRWPTLVVVALLALVATTWFAPVASSAFQDEDDSRGTTRAALEQWVEVKRKIEKEKHDWAIAKDLLSDRVEVLKLEIENQRENIAEAEKSISEADEKLTETDQRKAALESALAALRARVIAVENRTKDVLERLPDPVKERVAPLADRFPKEPETSEMRLADRFQTVVGILNAANKFNREVYSTPEVRKLADGRTAEVTTMYVGIGQAWFASADGSAAGHGMPGPEGWVFKPVAGDAEKAEVSRAVKILSKEENPAFVRIPVKVD